MRHIFILPAVLATGRRLVPQKSPPSPPEFALDEKAEKGIQREREVRGALGE
jgi:hypothetical protein